MTRHPHTIRRGPNPPAFRPHLECLEDRSVPATFHVTTALDVVDASDDKRSLREAITAANDTPEADTIILPAGTFKIALTGAGEDGNATGDFDITGSVTIRGAGASKTVIDAQKLDRAFDIRGTAPGSIGVVLEKVQVRNGNVDGPGGGILVGNANLTVRDGVIAWNQATQYGGGISNNAAPGTGNVTLLRTTIDRNVSEAGGGGVWVQGTGSVVVVRDSIIRRNAGDFVGGGIYADKLTVTNSTISHNYANDHGGGIGANKVTLTSSTVTGNSAGNVGGGISADRVTLNFSTVRGNSAENGQAGIEVNRALTLNFSTVSGNSRVSLPTLRVTTTLDVVNPADGKLSLREAITRANATPEYDTIVLPAGLFKIARSGAGEDGNATGDFDITRPIAIRGAGAGRTIIDGQQLDRVFDLRNTGSNTARMQLEQLQVRNGKVDGHGGGIQLGDVDLTVRDSIIAGNQATGTGGGVSKPSDVGFGYITLIRTTVARNVAGTNGGGVYTPFATFLTNSKISDNSATNGGGISSEYYASLTDSMVSGNTAVANGGGIFAGGGNSAVSYAILTNSTVSANSAMNGGGIYAKSSASLSASTISGNHATGSGGGIFSEGYASLTNSTASGNSAGASGGGIYANGGRASNSTIVKNTAQTGGGVFFTLGSIYDSFDIENTIIALNSVSGGSGPDLSGDPFTSQGHNLIGTGGNGFTSGVNGDIVGTLAAPIDPKIGDLKNNGGKTQTHALLADSPAIDGGGDVDNFLTTDQRGGQYKREKDGDGDGTAVMDIGAFEK